MADAPQKSRMAREIDEIPEVIERQIDQGLEEYLGIGRRLSEAGLHGFVTCARGTSDHAAMFFKYVMEIGAGLPVTSMGPSVVSVYATPLRLQEFACVTFSQSGASPDLEAFQAAAKRGGALTIAVANELDSPVGRGADILVPVLAGSETAVAATKSFVAMLFTGLGIAAGFLNDKELETSLRTFPATSRLALDCDWSNAEVPLAHSDPLYCVGRGPGLAAAAEAALKLKETCRLHAEAHSAAEVMHGPVVLADSNLAALLFDASGNARRSIDAAASRMRREEAKTFMVSSHPAAGDWLPVPSSGNPMLEPLAQIIAFYKFAESLSRKLGENADQPRGLKKVTETI